MRIRRHRWAEHAGPKAQRAQEFHLGFTGVRRAEDEEIAS